MLAKKQRVLVEINARLGVEIMLSKKTNQFEIQLQAAPPDKEMT